MRRRKLVGSEAVVVGGVTAEGAGRAALLDGLTAAGPVGGYELARRDVAQRAGAGLWQWEGRRLSHGDASRHQRSRDQVMPCLHDSRTGGYPLDRVDVELVGAEHGV